MEIKFDADPSQLGKTLKDILDILTHDQKSDIAKQVLTDWLKAPYDYERKMQELKVVNKIKEQSYHKNDSEDKIRGSYEFLRDMKDFKSTREIMIEEIITQTISYYKSLVKDIVENDEHIKKVKDEILEKIKVDFPNAIHDAVTFLLAQQLGNLGNAVQESLMKSTNTDQLLTQITDRLNNNNIVV